MKAANTTFPLWFPVPKSRTENRVLLVAALAFPTLPHVTFHLGQTNRHLIVHIFPRFVSAACTYCEFWLVHWILRLWLGRTISSFCFYDTQMKGRWTIGQGEPFPSPLAQAYTLPFLIRRVCRSCYPSLCDVLSISQTNKINEWSLQRLEIHSISPPKKAEWIRYWT